MRPGHEEPDEAVPGVDPHTCVPPVALALVVDGQRFDVRRAPDGGTHYAWVGGPDPGYGYATTASADRPEHEHVADIRSFLSMIDPMTGYIAED